jgi:5-oxoprolinase (ATP-hydrolysing)
MANAIKKISLQRGYDLTNYTLCCFGGAGAQVACLIADTLGMSQIFLHPYAGVLSAYGMGLADISATRVTGVEETLTEALISQLVQLIESLEAQARNELSNNQVNIEEIIVTKVNLKYEGTNSTLTVAFSLDLTVMIQEFTQEHKSRYGFSQANKNLIVESVCVEVIQKIDTPEEPLITVKRSPNELIEAVETVQMFTQKQWHNTPVYRREDLQPEDIIKGPAIIIEKISTIVIEPNWEATLTHRNHLILFRIQDARI